MLGQQKVEIRQLKSDDAMIYRHIRLEALKQRPEAFRSAFEVESNRSIDLFAETLIRNAVFGAFRVSELIGVVGFCIQQGPKVIHKGVLWGMYVQADSRNGGIGHQLAEAVINHARQHVELIQLSVVKENIHAQRLYASLGFSQYGFEEKALKYNGNYFDEVLMVKSFTSN